MTSSPAASSSCAAARARQGRRARRSAAAFTPSPLRTPQDGATVADAGKPVCARFEPSKTGGAPVGVCRPAKFPDDIDVEPSAKNFQLTLGDEEPCLLFARTKDAYVLEFAYPFSEFTALCAGLASVRSYCAYNA